MSTDSLLIGERQAARMLDVSERTLWAWRTSGIVPHVRIGRTVKYSIRSLEAWIQEQEAETINTGGKQNLGDPPQKRYR